MTRTLLVLRHAKSSWGNPRLRDFDRPLNERGRAAAALMGRTIAQRRLSPDLVLCSPAARARETLRIAAARFPNTPEIRFVESIYSARVPDLHREIRGQAGDVARLMIVGHNPAFHALANALAASGAGGHRHALARKFPTAALAVIDFDFSYWREMAPGTGTLREFMTPRALLGAGDN